MTREQQAQMLAEILKNPSDTAIVSTNAAALTQDYVGVLSEKEITEAENANLKMEMQKLREANMQLFLQVGKVPEDQPEQQADERPTFESLFDENGRLK